MRQRLNSVLLAIGFMALAGCGSDRVAEESSGQAADAGSTPSSTAPLPTLPVRSVAPEDGSVDAACDGAVAVVQGYGSNLFALKPGQEIDQEERRVLADAAPVASQSLRDHSAALGTTSPEVGTPLQSLSDIYMEMAQVWAGGPGRPEVIEDRERLSVELEAACKATGWRG